MAVLVLRDEGSGLLDHAFFTGEPVNDLSLRP